MVGREHSWDPGWTPYLWFSLVRLVVILEEWVGLTDGPDNEGVATRSTTRRSLPEVNSGYLGVRWRFGAILTDGDDLPDILVSVLGGYPPNGGPLPDPSELVT